MTERREQPDGASIESARTNQQVDLFVGVLPQVKLQTATAGCSHLSAPGIYGNKRGMSNRRNIIELVIFSSIE